MNTNIHNALNMTAADESTMTPAYSSFGGLTPPPAHPGFGGPTPPPAYSSFGGPTPPPAHPSFGSPTPLPAPPSFGSPIPPPAHSGFGGPIPPPAHPGFGRHMPPHMRNHMIHLNFDDAAFDVLKCAIGDEDTAQAAAWIIQNAPPEIQVCAAQLLMLCGAASIVNTCVGTDCNVKFPSPAMNEEAQELYNSLYGDAGSGFVDILNTSPDEIAVLSRLIAYLGSEKKEEAS